MTITSIETPNIPGTPIFTLKGTSSHNVSCIMSAQDRSAWITPEKAFVRGEMAEKRIALPIGRVPGYIPSTIIGTPPHILWSIFPVVNISLTHKSALLILLPSKSNALSIIYHTHWPGSTMRWLGTGHVGAFLFHRSDFLKAIREAFARL